MIKGFEGFRRPSTSSPQHQIPDIKNVETPISNNSTDLLSLLTDILFKIVTLLQFTANMTYLENPSMMIKILAFVTMTMCSSSFFTSGKNHPLLYSRLSRSYFLSTVTSYLVSGNLVSLFFGLIVALMLHFSAKR